MFFHLSRHACSGIPDDDLHTDPATDGFNENITLSVNGLDAVCQEIHEYLVDLARQAFNQWQVSIFLMYVYPSLGLVIKQYQSGIQAIMQVGMLKFIIIQPGKTP